MRVQRKRQRGDRGGGAGQCVHLVRVKVVESFHGLRLCATPMDLIRAELQHGIRIHVAHIDGGNVGHPIGVDRAGTAGGRIVVQRQRRGHRRVHTQRERKRATGRRSESIVVGQSGAHRNRSRTGCETFCRHPMRTRVHRILHMGAHRYAGHIEAWIGGELVGRRTAGVVQQTHNDRRQRRILRSNHLRCGGGQGNRTGGHSNILNGSHGGMVGAINSLQGIHTVQIHFGSIGDDVGGQFGDCNG